jgi:hypothetical protein
MDARFYCLSFLVMQYATSQPDYYLWKNLERLTREVAHEENV